MIRARLAWVLSIGLLLLSGCPAGPDRGTGGPQRASRDASPRDGGTDAGSDAAVPDFFATADLSYSEPRRIRRDPNDVCEPVRENLDRAARSILAGRTDRGVPATPWDKVKPPKYLDIVDRRFLLTGAEKAMLRRNGFAVSQRFETGGFARAFHDVYQSQLPIYVSADAILHSVFKTNDAILEHVELELSPKLEALLAAMHDALPKYREELPPEIATDLDVYLTVGRALLAEGDIPPKLGTATESTTLIDRARKGSGGLVTTTLFGRPRIIDFSQYTPRGHYAKSEDLQRYFKSSMWLSRIELNLVSRASRSSQPGIVPNPEETPREAVVALALAELASRAKVLGELDRLELAWTHFAGKREDVSIRSLLALSKKAGIGKLEVPGSAEKLKAAIGTSFPRTTRVHYMPQGSTPLPAIATMLGPRIVPDAQAETELVHAQVDGRSMPSFADVAYLLGHDRAKTWLAPDLARFPALGAKLEAGRATVQAAPATDMYGAWLGAIRGLSVTPPGQLSSYTKTTAYEDLRVNSAIAAYGQLRHNYVLIAGQAYDEGGCEVPDGWVEPALAVYDALSVYAKRGGEAMKALGVEPEAQKYFARLDTTMQVLSAIIRDELAGRVLSEEEKRWLSMVVEIVPPSSDGPGSYDGWYFDLFESSNDAFTDHAFVADWFTSSNANAVVYAGASEPRLGFFVVDVGGEPRVMVGPVARAFEHIGSLDKRLADADADKIRDRHEPWASSYTTPAPPTPPLDIISLTPFVDNGHSFALRSSRPLGPVTVELLDHHRVVFASTTTQVGTGWTRAHVRKKDETWPEVIRVRIGEFTHEISGGFGETNESIGGRPPLEWEAVQKLRERLDPPRHGNSSL